MIGAMDTRFLMASMGYVVGEKITRSFEEATKTGTSGHFVLLLRRCQNAGRNRITDADGKNLRSY